MSKFRRLAGFGALASVLLANHACQPSQDPSVPSPVPTVTTTQPDPEPEPDPTTTEPDPEPEPDPTDGVPSTEDVPAPPAELVGRWNGGPGGSSRWLLTITSSGRYSLISEELGLSDEGDMSPTGSGGIHFEGEDARVPEAAGVQDCDFSVGDAAGVGTLLSFCGGQSTFIKY